MLYEKCREILSGRGIPNPPDQSFLLRDDGNGPFISSWDVSALGAQPTPAELNAASASAGVSVISASERDADLSSKALKALMLAVDQRFRRVFPTDTTTADEWEAAIRTEYDAL